MSSEAMANSMPIPSADYAEPIEQVPPRSYARQVLADTFVSWRARMGAVWIGVLVLMAVFAPLIANSHPILLKMNGKWSSPLLRSLTGIDVVLLILAMAGVVLLTLRRMTWGRRAAILLWILAVTVPLVAWPAVARGWAPGGDILRPVVAYTLLGLTGAADLAVLVLVFLWSGFRTAGESGVSLRSAPGVGRGRGALLVIAAVLSGVLIAFPVRPPETVVYEQYRVAKKAGAIEYALDTPIPYSPTDRLRDQPGTRLSPPSREHWLGTEVNGADVCSRMIHASRIALSIGFISTGIAVVIGVVVGGIMGYFAGKVDIIGMRLVEIFEAIPTLFLLITFVAFFERSLYMIMVIIGLVGWTGNARFIRAEFLKLRKQDFVQAAIAAGLPLRSVLFRHMLPNGITPVLVSASFGVASAILAEATLSFLGLGLVDEPSWGQMLEQARSVGGTFTWWMAIFPGLAIFLTVFAYNMVGESLRDAIDPRIRKE